MRATSGVHAHIMRPQHACAHIAPPRFKCTNIAFLYLHTLMCSLQWVWGLHGCTAWGVCPGGAAGSCDYWRHARPGAGHKPGTHAWEDQGPAEAGEEGAQAGCTRREWVGWQGQACWTVMFLLWSRAHALMGLPQNVGYAINQAGMLGCRWATAAELHLCDKPRSSVTSHVSLSLGCWA